MMIYLFQTILVSALLSLGYYVFFRKSTQFQLRRLIIISIPILSLILPFTYKIKFIKNPVAESALFERMLGAVEVGEMNSQYSGYQNSYIILFAIIYGVIILFLCAKLFIQIRHILRLKSSVESAHGVFIIENTHQAFSFFNSIYIPQNQADNIGIIVKHETVHKEQLHSLDVIYFEILKVLFWINPFIYLLKNEVSYVHEFIVDHKLIKDETNINEYCEILMQSGSLSNMAIGNNFRNSLTKIRFIMMTKSNNRKSAPVRILGMMAIIFGIAIVLHGCNNEENKALNHDGNVAVEHESTNEQEQQEQNVNKDKYDEVEVFPSYPGGNDAMVEYLSTNIEYPEVAKENGVHGQVYVKFVIGKEGQISKVQVLRGVSPEIDAEAIRVISAMPNWNPAMKDGNPVEFGYTIPLKFQLDEIAEE